MRLKKFTPAKAVPNLISKDTKGYLYPDGRFTNGFVWLELPKEAAERAKAKKLNLETKDLPSLGRAIASYRQGQPVPAKLLRFYYDATKDDYKKHKWYAEFAANGTIYSYNADCVLALEYAAAQIDQWLIFTEASKPVLEAWNGHCIGGVFPLVRNTPESNHWKPKEA